MEVVVQARQTRDQAQTLRPLVETRVRAATQRMTGLLSRAVVRLKDLNGPRGGVDKECQIQINTARGDVLVVSSRGSDWRTALDTALSCAMQALARRFEARKTKPASKPGALAIHQVA
jgi:hypothetical protein